MYLQIEKKSSRSERLRSAICGLLSFSLLTAAFPPIGWSLLVFLAWIPFFVDIQRTRGRVFWPGFLLGEAFFGSALLYWITAMTTVGAASYVVWFGVSFLHVLFALPLGFFLRWLLRRGVSVFWAAPLPFAAQSFLREKVTNIAWHDPGYALADWTLCLQSAEWGGPQVLSLMGMFCSAGLAELWLAKNGAARWSKRGALICGGGLLLCLVALPAWGAWRIRDLEGQLKTGPLVAGIQPNVTLEERADPKISPYDLYSRRLDLTERVVGPNGPPPDLLVWPESAFPPVRDFVDPAWSKGQGLESLIATRGRLATIEADLIAATQRTVKGPFSSFLVGANYRRQRTKPGAAQPAESNRDLIAHYNAAFFLAANKGRLRSAGRYDKRTLVPFGEATPFAWWPALNQGLRDFVDETAGPGFYELTPGLEQTRFELPLKSEEGTGQASFAASICYEIVFPGHFSEAREQEVDFLLNISNDVWYGDSNEMDLVHQQARFRAVEVRLSLFRLSNTGISALIDPLGREIVVVEQHGERKNVPGVLRGRIPIGLDAPLGPDTGRWAMVLATLILGVWAAVSGRAKRP